MLCTQYWSKFHFQTYLEKWSLEHLQWAQQVFLFSFFFFKFWLTKPFSFPPNIAPHRNITKRRCLNNHVWTLPTQKKNWIGVLSCLDNKEQSLWSKHYKLKFYHINTKKKKKPLICFKCVHRLDDNENEGFVKNSHFDLFNL